MMAGFKSFFANRLIREQGPLLGLISWIVFIFILQTALGRQWYNDFMTLPAEVTAAWRHLLQGDITPATLCAFGTLISSAFLHGSAEHLLFNMVFLWIFGALIAELLGQRWMIALFLISAISGSILHTVLNAGESIPMLGASGGVMGFMGAYLGLAIRWRLPDPHIWPMSRPIPPGNLALLAIIGIVLDLMGVMNPQQPGGIAYGAHIGGFFAGMFITSFLVRRAPTSVTS